MVAANKTGLRCAITDLSADLGDGSAESANAAARRQQRLHSDLCRWIADGIDFVQLREKTLDAGELFALATTAMSLLSSRSSAPTDERRPKLLVNSRADIAAAARADGIHLTARPGELLPDHVRAIFHAAGLPHCTVSVSCHTLEDVTTARRNGADLVLFGPVFEKRIGERLVADGMSLESLHMAAERACPIPVLALGGITDGLVDSCLQAGAAGVAGIRLFSPLALHRT